MISACSVLVVEDDADVRHCAHVALSAHVSFVQTMDSPNGLDAALGSHTFDVVLLDMNFTGGKCDGSDGKDALAYVRSVDPTLSVILMTAYGSVSLAVDALKQGATDFVLKPWRNDKLIGAVISGWESTRSRRAEERLTLDALERNAINRALMRHEGNVSAAAAALGLSRAALYRRISKYGL
jgi:two-component system, response regulator RegA